MGLGPDRRHVRSLIAAGCAIALAGLAAMTGLAGAERVATEAATMQLAGDSAGGATARCAGKARAISGGFRSEFEPGQLQQYESRRKGRRGWRGSAYNNDSAAADLTAFVYCRGQRLEAKSKRETIAGTPIMASPETGRATAKCPRGTTAVSGGFDNPTFAVTGNYMDSTRVIPYESRRQRSRKWTVAGSNRGGQEGTLAAFAYCNEGSPLKTKRKSTTFTAAPGEVEVGTVVAKCAKGRRVVSGGFAIAGLDQDPLASKKTGSRKWTASAIVAFPGETRITAYAYCEPIG